MAAFMLFMLLFFVLFLVDECLAFHMLARNQILCNYHSRQTWSFLPSSSLSSSLPISRRNPTLFLAWGSFFGGGNDNPKSSSSSKDGREQLRGIEGILESMGNLEQAQKAGKLTSSLLQELQSTTVEGVAENGRVKVVLDCQQRPVRVVIDEEFLSSSSSSTNSKQGKLSASELSNSLMLAMQDAHTKSIEKMDEKLKSLFSEFGLETP